ncbi:MAG: type I DNA topoisomerase [Bacteroidota bacterium]|nr:type I DNA topoisomerase [Bacteroidota bacterium]MDP4192325.1 type I DNA topoisomerase [Bacteroidota bacterium]MDP4195594.1 type I DNA topoisomerase [Bacteroidota bacterium]
MSKNLVLVESPSKAKTINKYLGKDFLVEATVGHIRNLPKTKLGVEIENDFKPQLVNIRGKGDVIKKIKSLASKSKTVFIATDPDREGEAIAQDIADVIEGITEAKIKRVLFNEITKNAVQKAMKSPLEIDSKLVTSQRARRVMDRIIGYQISPLLWKSVIDPSNNNLSAGRVQSVALRLICEREEEIEKFIPTEYWAIWAEFKTEKNETFRAKLAEIDGKTIRVLPKPVMTDEDWKVFLENNVALNNESSSQEILDRISKKDEFVISDVVKKEGRRNPPPPFITSSLQSEASKNLRLKPSHTMAIAQSLYEGVDLGKEGLVGLITYMRTDSTRVSQEIMPDLRNYIQDVYGNKYLPEEIRTFDKKNGSNVQDAHEAIRPTSMKYTPEFVKPFLDPKQLKLYELIWKRFVASQMNSAIVETTTIEVKAEEFLFKASGTAIKFDGFLQVYEEQSEDFSSKDEGENDLIPLGLQKDQKVDLQDLHKTQHFTKPPARFSESTLIKELESKGIGRPSTYASIVGTIQDRNYVLVEEKRLRPTELGKKINTILVKSFPEILNVNFTAKMEDELDLIAQGESQYLKVLNDFYGPFTEALSKVEENVEKVYCDLCGSEMVIKMGRFGKFLACSNYPECKNIKSLKDLQQDKPQEPEYTGDTCEKCGGRLVYRMGRFGKFIGCEKYPDCDYIKPITTGVKCPKCKTGDVIERQSRKGKTFFGCSRYPDCDFVAWYRPISMACPNKDSDYLEKRYSAKKGEYFKCPVCGEEVIPEVSAKEEE